MIPLALLQHHIFDNIVIVNVNGGLEITFLGLVSFGTSSPPLAIKRSLNAYFLKRILVGDTLTLVC